MKKPKWLTINSNYVCNNGRDLLIVFDVLSFLSLECVSHDEGSGDDDDELMNPVLTPDSKTKGSPNF